MCGATMHNPLETMCCHPQVKPLAEERLAARWDFVLPSPKSLQVWVGIREQEQLMQIAIDVANFTPADADMLRQAMGSKRSRERMDDL